MPKPPDTTERSQDLHIHFHWHGLEAIVDKIIAAQITTPAKLAELVDRAKTISENLAESGAVLKSATETNQPK